MGKPSHIGYRRSSQLLAAWGLRFGVCRFHGAAISVVKRPLLINFSINAPLRMPYYAAMTTLGSLAGCTALFLVVRKGKQTLSHGESSRHAARVNRWMERNGFLTLLVGAILPPPTPFKLFVFAAGALEMPLRTFVLAMAIARSVRFFGEGLLAIRYGRPALLYITDHKLLVTMAGVATVLVCYLAVRVIFRDPQAQETKAS